MTKEESHMSVDAVVFDIGNVLIEWQPERHYDAVVGKARREELFKTVDMHEVNDLVDRGTPWRETIEAASEKHPEFRDEILMWYFEWIKMAQPMISGSVILMRALQAKGVPVFALTNFGIESFEYAETQYPFLAEFDRTYVSGRMGCVKPYSLIYEMLEADCGIAADRLLFTDDRAENIEMATKRGWQTHLFEGAEGWAETLVSKGLLTKDEAKLS